MSRMRELAADLRAPRRWSSTLLLRSLVLASLVLLANAMLWSVSGGVLSKEVIGLALIAWVTGLRHGVDADHIAVIDNSIRRFISNGTSHLTPILTGTFFSLGHSTIVLSVVIAVAVSVAVADNLGGVGNVGGVIGTAISGSMLMLLAVINTCILVMTLRSARRRGHQNAAPSMQIGAVQPQEDSGEKKGQDNVATRWAPRGCFTTIFSPLLKLTDRPWKMYLVGLAFGIGFDTASSVVLLSVAAIATTAPQNQDQQQSHGSVILLALLFASGMCLVDTLDSIMMVYAYTPEDTQQQGFRLFVARSTGTSPGSEPAAKGDVEKGEVVEQQKEELEAAEASRTRELCTLQNGPASGSLRSLPMTTKLSLLMTVVSIAMAFTISMIQIMGLIAEQCTQCAAAADAERDNHDGGLAGRWWKGWQDAAENSTFIGIGIAGFFFAVLGSFLVYQLFMMLRRRTRRQRALVIDDQNVGPIAGE